MGGGRRFVEGRDDRLGRQDDGAEAGTLPQFQLQRIDQSLDVTGLDDTGEALHAVLGRAYPDPAGAAPGQFTGDRNVLIRDEDQQQASRHCGLSG